MNIFFKKNQTQSIESLEFYFFLQKLYISLRGKHEESTNRFILDFLKLLQWFYLWEGKKIYPYIRVLTDQVLWKSSKFYRETMRKFVDGELNALEFAQEFSDRLLAEREEADNLVEDLKKQANMELNPNIFGFSRIILDFQRPLEVYQNEVEELETGELSENNLSFTPDSLIEGVKHALEQIDPYFTD